MADSQSGFARFLADMSAHPHYQDFLEEVLRNRPPTGRYNPNDPLSVEKWKLASGDQRGYDRFAALLKLKISEDAT